MFKSILFDVYLYLAYRSIWFNKQNRFCWHIYVSDICSSSQLPVVKVTAFSVETFISQIHAVYSRFLVVTVRDFCWHISFSDTLSYWLLKKVVIARLVSATDDTQPSEVSSWPTSIHQGRLHLGPNPSILLEMLSLKCFVFIWAWLLACV